jgi:thiol-disulfide isomerase/thioredoxin
LQFAQKHANAPAAVDALVWVLENAAVADKDQATGTASLRDQALQLLTRDHLMKPEFANVCQRLADKPLPDVEELLRTAVAKHAEKDVRGLAGFALGLCLARQAEQWQSRDAAKAASLVQQAEQQLLHVQEQYGLVPYGEKKTLGEASRQKLYELRYLTVGRPAAEIEGKDFDSRPFKLSDYKGKVVFLDFWANWCGYCRQMYPHERELVQRYKGRPFALLGVNCDEDKEEVLREIKKQHLDWRSWWDGGSAGDRIAKQWQIHSFPTTFVLDHKGVIRYRGVRGGELDDAVEKLLKEREADQPRAGSK